MNSTELFKEIFYRTSKSSGPGGQHVNKTETKVEAVLNIKTSNALNEKEKQILLEKLKNKINQNLELSVTSEKFRSQIANKEHATEKLILLITKALIKPKKRKPTKPTKSSKEKRIKEKKIRSEIKKNRNKPV